MKFMTSQRGQGLVEYALLFGFVGAFAAFVFFNGGLGGSISNTFGGAKSNLSQAIGTDSDETSFDYETQSAADVGATYKTLNWQEIIVGVQGMYTTVLRSTTADKALTSETNLFGQIAAMVEGHLASTKQEDGLKDWQTFLATIDNMRTQNNFSSSYTRGEESIAISRLGNSNTMQIRYTDGKEVVYYRLSPDANNVMQIETNSNKSYTQFFGPMVASGGWSKSQ